MRFYSYFYYRLYSWYKKRFGETDAPHFSAYMMICLLMLINTNTAILFTLLFFDIESVNLILDSKYIVIAIIAILNYLYFLRKQRFKDIYDKWESKMKNKKQLSSIILWGFVLLSFILLGFAIWIQDYV